MRGGVLCLTVLVASLAAAPTALAHPGHANPFVDVGRLKYDPASLTVYAGDSVVWLFAGPDTDHTVTSDLGSAETFDLTTDGSHTFATPGTFTYHCKIHSFMTGTVVVEAAPVTPVDPSAGPPRVTRLSAKVRSGRLEVRFAITQPADLQLVLRRSGKRVREIGFGAPPGAGTKKVSAKKLKPGAYTATLIAVDRATGVASKAVRASFRVAAKR